MVNEISDIIMGIGFMVAMACITLGMSIVVVSFLINGILNTTAIKIVIFGFGIFFLSAFTSLVACLIPIRSWNNYGKNHLEERG
jgi:hypothetical protein